MKGRLDGPLSRRALLASVGTLGLGVAGVSLFTGESRAYTTATRVPLDSVENAAGSRTRERGLDVAWWSSYNGRVVETQGSGAEASAGRALDPETAPRFVPEASGPLIGLDGILPGDEGMVGVGIEADVPAGESVAVWCQLRLISSAENGVNEPESKHPGEDGPEDGELADLTRVTVWENNGTAGIGANDGRLTPIIERAVESGSLRAVATDSVLGAGIRLGCLDAGGTTYLALRWELPATVGNVVQSDSATFDLEFRTTSCEATNPFEGEETDG